MNDRELGALLLESAWLSARLAAGGALAATFAAVVVVHSGAHRGGASAVPPRVRPAGSGVRFALMAAVLAVALAATWFSRGQAAAWFAPAVQAVVAALGALTALFGSMIAIWSAAALGPNLAVGASVRGDERASLVTTGPFALVRHPLYAAVGLLAAGTALAWGSGIGLAWVLLAYPHTAAWRADLEEQALATAWPDAWPDYAARTPRFIPKL